MQLIELLGLFPSVREPVILELAVEPRLVTVSILCSDSLACELDRLIRGVFPYWEIEPTKVQPGPSAGALKLVAHLERPEMPDFIPSRRFDTYKQDPVASLLEACLPIHANEQVLIDYYVQPLTLERYNEACQGLTVPRPPTSPAEFFAMLFGHGARVPKFEPKLQKVFEEKMTAPAFEVVGTVTLISPDREQPLSRYQTLRTVFAHRFDAGFGGGFLLGDYQFRAGSTSPSLRYPRGPSLYLTVAELAALWHPPGGDVAVPGVQHMRYQTPVLSPQLFSANGPRIGTIRQRGEQRLIPLPRQSFKHGAVLCLGIAGQGKSTLAETIVAAELAAPDRPGALVLDPPGTFVTDLVMRSLPPEREPDVVLLELGDTDYPVSLPLFQRPPGCDQETFIATTYGLLRTLFQDGTYSESRMDSTVFALAAALCSKPGSTLWDVQGLLYDPIFRRRAVAKLTDPVALAWWANLERSSPGEIHQVAQPVITRLEKLYRSRPIQNMLLQRQGPQLMGRLDQGAIILVSLAGNAMQEELSLLGELMLTRLKTELWSRLTRESRDYRRVILAIDETHRFKGVTLPQLLREARKTGLAPQILATQYLSGWSEQLSESVMGNLGTLITFKCPNDASKLSHLLPPFTATQLATLDRHWAVASLQLEEGTTLPAFAFQTLPVTTAPDYARLERVRIRSRALFTKPRHEVEEEIARMMRGEPPQDDHNQVDNQVNDVDEE